jgi:hypothetical protein
MRKPREIAELVRRLRTGDAVAGTKPFTRYARRLTRLAEKYLWREVGRRVAVEDVVQSVFRAFSQCAARGAFHIDSSAQLWHLVVKSTVHRARCEGRYHSGAMRDVQAEERAASLARGSRALEIGQIGYFVEFDSA